MYSIIKNAIIYHVELPSLEATAGHLAEIPFVPLGDEMAWTRGFVPVPFANELVVDLMGKGMAFCMRVQEKAIPRAALRKAQQDAIDQYRQNNGLSELGEETTTRIKSDVYREALSHALPTDHLVMGYYHRESQYLFVNTANKDVADSFTSLLVQAIGSITSKTINISGLKKGLTTKLVEYLQDVSFPGRDQFGDFRLGDSVQLANGSEKLTIQISSIDLLSAGVIDAQRAGMEVTRIALTSDDGLTFKLTDKFHMRGIKYNVDVEEQEDSEAYDPVHEWKGRVTAQLLMLVSAADTLCEMFKYQEQQEPATAEA